MKRFVVSLWNTDFKMYTGNYECDTEEEIYKLIEDVRPGRYSRAKIIDRANNNEVTYID